MTEVVVINEREVGQDLLLGHAELNVAGTLNSLSLDMIRILRPVLAGWAERDEVVGVVITGAGDKAFCAGGDIQALYHAIVANHAADKVVDDYPFRFFEQEYRLDYALHTYPKPVLTLGHGIVMGGGLGILSGSKYRVLTERSRLAVPEITIGLFPDAGASWTLKNMSPHHAAFLGLTGSHVNATDGLLTNMGTHVIAHDARQEWMNDLLGLPWSGKAAADDEMVAAWLSATDGVDLPASELAAVPDRVPDFTDLQAECAAIASLAGRSKWIDKGIANLTGGCPTTAGIVVEQLHRVGQLNLADAFRMELVVATHCAQNNDFVEGVRALLIDKDGKPDWAYGSVSELPRAHVLGHFEPPWPQNPLHDLA